MAFRKSKIKNKMTKRNLAKLECRGEPVFNMLHIQAVNTNDASLAPCQNKERGLHNVPFTLSLRPHY